MFLFFPRTSFPTLDHSHHLPIHPIHQEVLLTLRIYLNSNHLPCHHHKHPSSRQQHFPLGLRLLTGFPTAFPLIPLQSVFQVKVIVLRHNTSEFMLLVRSYQWFPNAVIIKFKLFSKLYKALHEPIMPHSLTLFIMTFFMILKYNKCIWMSDIVLVFSPIGNSWLAP